MGKEHESECDCPDGCLSYTRTPGWNSAVHGEWEPGYVEANPGLVYGQDTSGYWENEADLRKQFPEAFYKMDMALREEHSRFLVQRGDPPLAPGQTLHREVPFKQMYYPYTDEDNRYHKHRHKNSFALDGRS